MAWFSWVALLVVVAGAALAAYCAMQFTTMPILFFGHIAAMLLCWWLMTSGSVIYAVAKLWSGSRDSARTFHAAIQSAAVLAAVAGYVCIFSNHRLVGGSQFGFDPGNPPAKTLHALFGYIVLSLILLQAFQGWSKFMGLQACNMALILTTFPFTEALFVTLAGGFLLLTFLAVVIAGPAGKSVASARPKQRVTRPCLMADFN
ncbi:unnamed protein product [Durusdinium trenchii]|uniref:Cytochrome b561 domain-containing protein n=1 Tax=Durusdinium trenchii TaxID=1381693 RepID=A0ABP0SW11_9DINO